MEMLIAEDLLLLLLDDESGKLGHATYLDTGIGGAVLVELALAGCVEVTEGSGAWARSKVTVLPTTPPADPVLREAIELIAAKERTAQDLVGRLGKRRRKSLLERLERAGIVRRQEDKVLGLFPRRRWPAVDAGHENDLRRRLGDALLRGVEPDQRTAALIALLSALDVAHKVIDREGLPTGQVKRRAKDIAQGDWAAKAVRDAVRAAQAAVTAAAVAAGAAGSAGG